MRSARGWGRCCVAAAPRAAGETALAAWVGTAPADTPRPFQAPGEFTLRGESQWGRYMFKGVQCGRRGDREGSHQTDTLTAVHVRAAAVGALCGVQQQRVQHLRGVVATAARRVRCAARRCRHCGVRRPLTHNGVRPRRDWLGVKHRREARRVRLRNLALCERLCRQGRVTADAQHCAEPRCGGLAVKARLEARGLGAAGAAVGDAEGGGRDEGVPVHRRLRERGGSGRGLSIKGRYELRCGGAALAGSAVRGAALRSARLLRGARPRATRWLLGGAQRARACGRHAGCAGRHTRRHGAAGGHGRRIEGRR